MKFTIIVGNPVDGFTCHGLFESQDEAIEAGQDSFNDQDWVIMPISPL